MARLDPLLFPSVVRPQWRALPRPFLAALYFRDPPARCRPRGGLLLVAHERTRSVREL